MESFMRPWNGLVLFVGVSFQFLNLAQAAPQKIQEPMRLIQTAPNQRQWMSQQEIFEFIQKRHETGHCGGFMDVTDRPEIEAPSVPHILMKSPTVSHPDLVNGLLKEISAQEIHKTVQSLSDFRDRFYQNKTGVEAAAWIKSKFEALAHGRSDIKVEYFNHSFKQPSVIARIQGKGPHAHERIVIGGHEDSINWGFAAPSDRPAPGADDDASGVATVLEIFRVLAQSGYQPDRTLEFMTYAGEELGLLGSQDIAQKYKTDKTAVLGVMQFDMTMYPGNTSQMTFISDFVSKEMTRFTEQVADTYVKFPWVESDCGYACSDHASWTDAGYASVFPFEAPFEEYNHAIHTEKDVLNLLDSDFGSHFAKLGLAWAVELGTE